jgi:hypothetical protein
MNKEKQTESNDNNVKDTQIEKEKNTSTFLPLNEKDQNDLRINQNLLNLQNSACKNLKNDVKSESANNFM